jgi:hypothetical protein
MMVMKRGLILFKGMVLVASLLAVSLPSPALAAGNATVGGTLELVPTFRSISVYALFTDDDNGNNQATLEYREAGGTWKPGVEMVADRRATLTTNSGNITNPFQDQWRASVLLVSPDTDYEIRVTFTDPDGVNGTNPVTGQVTTLDPNAPTSNGSVWYVSTTGSDSTGDGSPGDPYRTIAQAMTRWSAGDIIDIAGTHSEGVTMSNVDGSPGNWYTFRSNAADPGILNGGATYGFNISGSSYIKITGLNISNYSRCSIYISNSTDIDVDDDSLADGDWDYRGLVTIAGSSARVWVRNTTIFQTSDNGVQWFGIAVNSTDGNHIFYNNYFHGGDGSYYYDAIGGTVNSDLNGGPGPDTDIYDNVIRGVYDDGIEVDGGDMNVRVWGNDIYNQPPQRGKDAISWAPVIVGPLYVFRNVIGGDFYDGGAFKVGGGGSAPSTGAAFIWHNSIARDVARGVSAYGNTSAYLNQQYRNNIFQVDKRAIKATDASTVGNTYDYDLFNPFGSGHNVAEWNGQAFTNLADFTAASGHEAHGLDADPLFVNAGGGDLRLQGGSPAIDQGVIIPGFNDAGSPQPYSGAAPDIGAYEYGSGAPANYPPVLGAIGNKSVSEGDLLQFTISATDPDGDSLVYSATNLPSGASFNPGTRTFTWTPGSGQAGSYPKEVAAAEVAVAGLTPGHLKSPMSRLMISPRPASSSDGKPMSAPPAR